MTQYEINFLAFIQGTIGCVSSSLHDTTSWLTFVQDLDAYPMTQIETMEAFLVRRGCLTPSGETDPSPHLISDYWKRTHSADMHSIGWCVQPIEGKGYYPGA